MSLATSDIGHAEEGTGPFGPKRLTIGQAAQTTAPGMPKTLSQPSRCSTQPSAAPSPGYAQLGAELQRCDVRQQRGEQHLVQREAAILLVDLVAKARSSELFWDAGGFCLEN